VWVDAGDHPWAYLIAAIVDGNAYIEQVTVHPNFAHRRIGWALIESLMQWAKQRRLPAVTLTTYTEVKWNGPYYERQGFRRLDDGELTAGLRKIRTAEIARGLDQWPRACMRFELCGQKNRIG
jgi:ribosomal protein S18 acetylase RimI-like enzyme